MINVVVDRNMWYRGKGMVESRLLRTDGQKCCIGFLAIKLGAYKEELSGCHILDEVEVKTILKFRDKHNEELTEAYVANDATNITDDVREARLIIIGQEMNVNFSFIN